MNSFYVYLPSNTPEYPNNSANKFRVRLPKTLVFNGNWVCGLHIISFPYSWPATIGALDEQWITIHFVNDAGLQQRLRLPIAEGSHENVQELELFIKSIIQEQSQEMKKTIENQQQQPKSSKFKIHSNSNNFTIT